MSRDESKEFDSFRVPPGRHLLEGMVHRRTRLWVRLGRLETWCLGSALDGVEIDRPVFVAGLARSGTTILLHVLADHPHVATHRHRDFPLVFTPYWWNEIVRRAPCRPAAATERAHRDGIMITPDSPEAMEEPLWMAFFPDAHDPAVSQVLDASVERPDFERFFRDHLRKLLLVRGGRRYAAKGNYHLTRLQYLLKVLPDARFVLPVRRPASHVASLMRQQRRFSEGQSRHRRALDHMRWAGHFEFGLDRRPLNVGDWRVAREILDLWEQGEEVRGWARYWARVYGWLADRMADDARLRRAARLVRFEDLCRDPGRVLREVLSHADLHEERLIARSRALIRAPGGDRQRLSPREEAIVAEETAEVAKRLGYKAAEPQPAAACD